MNKSVEFSIIIVWALVLAWFPLKNILELQGQTKLYRAIFPVEYLGVLKDVSNGWYLQGAQIKLGDVVTYTDEKGRFSVKEMSFKDNRVQIWPPYNFQADGVEYNCQKSGTRLYFFGETFWCQGGFYPKPFEMARRILQAEDSFSASSREAIEDKLSQIWGMSAKTIQSEWGNRELFVGSLINKYLIDSKLGKSPESSSVVSEGHPNTEIKTDNRTDDSMRYFVVPVKRILKDQTSVALDMNFVGDGYTWKWLPLLSRREVEFYIKRHSRFLR